MTFSDSLREQAEKVFAARKDKPGYIDYEFKVYAGTQHGFAARPDLSLPEIVKAHEEAFIQSKNWFEKTLA
ncbi:hypothetical protein QCA50_014667 [Cerrena zonata]|uniref:Dienelactone hydrolase domain-containing protein n=1 Tax=Cerrena zonata TaxID=2478898 RepID=A0AAW0FXI2_9APHY